MFRTAWEVCIADIAVDAVSAFEESAFIALIISVFIRFYLLLHLGGVSIAKYTGNANYTKFPYANYYFGVEAVYTYSAYINPGYPPHFEDGTHLNQWRKPGATQ